MRLLVSGAQGIAGSCIQLVEFDLALAWPKHITDPRNGEDLWAHFYNISQRSYESQRLLDGMTRYSSLVYNIGWCSTDVRSLSRNLLVAVVLEVHVRR